MMTYGINYIDLLLLIKPVIWLIKKEGEKFHH